MHSPPVDSRDDASTHAPATAAAEPPKSLWDKVIVATPVVMTIVATILAGLSSSEMSQAQYYRSVASQQQSKASDQWSLFQAKRQRGISASHTADLLQAIGDSEPFSLDTLTKAGAPATQPADIKAAADVLAKPQFPPIDTSFGSPAINAAYKALADGESETANPALFAQVDEKALHDALKKSEQRTLEAEDAIDPGAAGVKQIGRTIRGLTPAGATATPQAKQVSADFTAARLRYEDAREHHEAKLNQVTAYLYEISVRKWTIESERHRTRSSYFFFGMLAAQAAVTIATIALAAKVRSTLWILAASIGVIAVAYAAYVYLFT